MTHHNEIACCYEGCMGLICLTPEQEEKLRRTHETFRCPFGHAQGWYGDTDEEKEIKRLKRIIAAKNDLLTLRQERVERLQFECRSLRARLGAKTRKLRSVA